MRPCPLSRNILPLKFPACRRNQYNFRQLLSQLPWKNVRDVPDLSICSEIVHCMYNTYNGQKMDHSGLTVYVFQENSTTPRSAAPTNAATNALKKNDAGKLKSEDNKSSETTFIIFISIAVPVLLLVIVAVVLCIGSKKKKVVIYICYLLVRM